MPGGGSDGDDLAQDFSVTEVTNPNPNPGPDIGFRPVDG